MTDRPKIGFTQKIKYMLKWSTFKSYIDGWVPKFAMFVPILGYAILFNDTIIAKLSLGEITSKENTEVFFNNLNRIRFMYFGLIFLGVSNLLYRFHKPKIFHYASNKIDFIERALNVYSFRSYEEDFKELGSEDPNNDWDRFEKSFKAAKNSMQPNQFSQIVSIHKSYLSVLLEDAFDHYVSYKKWWLGFCIILSTLGYCSLAIPSINVFIQVITATV